MYYLLTESFRHQEVELVRLVTAAVAAAKIYLLGSSLLHERTESVFTTSAPTASHAGHYWLLVLVEKETSVSHNSVQDKIENACRFFVPVTAIILDTAQFNTLLSEGHPFASTTIKIAVLLHDGSHVPLAMQKVIDETITRKEKEITIAQGIDKAGAFIAGAELFMLRKQNRMAAFMLHQAAEQSLLAILKAGTGLRISTHNIDKLIRYCSMFCYKLPGIFPADNEKNQRLLNVLQRAYIDTRYKEDFTVSNSDLVIILQRIKILIEVLHDMAKVSNFSKF